MADPGTREAQKASGAHTARDIEGFRAFFAVAVTYERLSTSTRYLDVDRCFQFELLSRLRCRWRFNFRSTPIAKKPGPAPFLNNRTAATRISGSTSPNIAQAAIAVGQSV